MSRAVKCPMGIVIVVALAAGGALADSEGGYGWVIAQSAAKVRSAPRATAAPTFQAKDGERLRVEEKLPNGTYVRVRNRRGQSGWITSNLVASPGSSPSRSGNGGHRPADTLRAPVMEASARAVRDESAARNTLIVTPATVFIQQSVRGEGFSGAIREFGAGAAVDGTVELTTLLGGSLQLVGRYQGASPFGVSLPEVDPQVQLAAYLHSGYLGAGWSRALGRLRLGTSVTYGFYAFRMQAQNPTYYFSNTYRHPSLRIALDAPELSRFDMRFRAAWHMPIWLTESFGDGEPAATGQSPKSMGLVAGLQCVYRATILPWGLRPVGELTYERFQTGFSGIGTRGGVPIADATVVDQSVTLGVGVSRSF